MRPFVYDFLYTFFYALWVIRINIGKIITIIALLVGYFFIGWYMVDVMDVMDYEKASSQE